MTLELGEAANRLITEWLGIDVVNVRFEDASTWCGEGTCETMETDITVRVHDRPGRFFAEGKTTIGNVGHLVSSLVEGTPHGELMNAVWVWTRQRYGTSGPYPYPHEWWQGPTATVNHLE